jgi:hypothetical protein
MYPNFNQNPIIELPCRNSKYPRYIINALILRELLGQYDNYYFEKFLNWRSDPKMPIYCISELDYWDYFTKMQNGLDKKRNYDLAIKKNIRVIYNGNRFNSPKYFKQ